VRSLPRCTTVGCSEKSILLFSPYFTTLSVVVRVCIRKPVNKGFSADFAKWNISDASVGTEELGHLEMVGTIVHQLTRNLTVDQIKEAGFDTYFVDHTTGVFPQFASGYPWSAATMQVTGDTIADLTEDLAAEQKARVTYDNILRLSDDPDVNDVIKFLRAREIVHFQRFGEGLRLAKEKLDEKNVYFVNPSFDR
jgi:spore coat protein JC